MIYQKKFERNSYGVKENDNCDISKVFIVNKFIMHQHSAGHEESSTRQAKEIKSTTTLW